MHSGAVVAMLLSGAAFGQLFAVAPGPRLVTVDPDTGGVAEIGDLVLEGNIANLECVGQRLYATESSFPNGASLIELNTRDASILSRHAITLDGVALVNAIEGLGYDAGAGSLVQAFWRAGAPSTSSSASLGYVGFDGTVTGALAYAADFDGLANRGSDGSMYWVDREPGPRTVGIGVVTVGVAPSLLATYAFGVVLNGVNDVSLAPDRGELLAVDVVTGMVHRFDPGTAALLGSVAIETGEGLNAAAYRVRCDADLSLPYGVLDLADIAAFIGAFVGQEPAADLAAPRGLFDLADLTAFVAAFSAGCP